MSAGEGRRFYKMTGSGNDFVFFDTTVEPAAELSSVSGMRKLCARGTGVGADGVVFIEPSANADFRIRYYNSDGSPAALCGNASLCTTRLAAELGIGSASGLAFETDAGIVQGRIRDGLPEIDLQPIAGLTEQVGLSLVDGERHVGFAVVGVPHAVVLCDDVGAAPVVDRGRELRWHPTFADGANVNFVAADAGRLVIRTYERGVEGETLACGTGAVAAAALALRWGVVDGPDVALETRSGRTVYVRVPVEDGEPPLRRGPSLRGEGRLVFTGQLGEL